MYVVDQGRLWLIEDYTYNVKAFYLIVSLLKNLGEL
jgi:hypothetical protein